jgi:hypothetical protein
MGIPPERLSDYRRETRGTEIHGIGKLFMHIPKTGGTAVEKLLGLDHVGHAKMFEKKKQRLMKRGVNQFFTVMRNPLDTAVSAYFYYMTDKSSVMLESIYERQAKLCEPGTGLKYGSKCKAKLTPFEYVIKKCRAQQFMYLCPRAPWKGRISKGNVSLSEVTDLVDERFVLVGLTEELTAFMVVLAQVFNLPDVAQKITADVVNSVKHKKFRDLVTDAEFANVTAWCEKELRLYDWAKTRWAKTKKCFDQQWLEGAVDAARARSSRTFAPTNDAN